MRFLRFRDGRSQDYTLLQQSINDLEAAVAALASEVAAARSNAASADQSARRLVHKLDELEEEEDRAAQPRRVLCLAALCAVLLLSAGLVIYAGVRGFANPRAVTPEGNSITLAVQAFQHGKLDPQGLPVAHIYPVFQQDGGYTEYEIMVPPRFAGWRFALLLTGTARIGRPTEDSGDVPFRTRLTTCDVTPESALPTLGYCQLITGRFPWAEAYMPSDATNCQKLGDSSTDNAPNAIEIDLYGTSQINISSDWAYQQYALPSVSQPEAYVRGPPIGNELGGVPLGGFYSVAYTTGCTVDQLPQNTDLTDVSMPATHAVGRTLFWNGLALTGTAFTVRRRDADEISNALLATGAVVAALAIAFINVTYDADQKRRQARKRLHARQELDPA